MSWLSTRLTNGKADSPIMFECLKALIIGLGNGMCEENFRCDSIVILNDRKSTQNKHSTVPN